MSRAQLALDVDDLDEAITFYSKLVNTRPAEVKPGHANFAIVEAPLKLVLLENPGTGFVHRRGDRHHLLPCHAGQGVGDRTSWRRVGGVCRAFRHQRLLMTS